MRERVNIRSSDRTFELWHQAVSHQEMLVRSTKGTHGQTTNLDLEFAGVDYLEIPTRFEGFVLDEPTPEEIESLRPIVGPYVKPEWIRIISSGGKRYKVVSAFLTIYENDWGIYETPIQTKFSQATDDERKMHEAPLPLSSFLVMDLGEKAVVRESPMMIPIDAPWAFECARIDLWPEAPSEKHLGWESFVITPKYAGGSLSSIEQGPVTVEVFTILERLPFQERRVPTGSAQYLCTAELCATREQALEIAGRHRD